MKQNISILVNLAIKTIIYFFVFAFIAYGLFMAFFFFFKGGESKEGLIMFKAEYLTKKEKCPDLKLEDIKILNESFKNIYYSGGFDYWCNMEELHFFQNKDEKTNELDGKKTVNDSIEIPSQVGKLKNLYKITLVNIKIDGNLPKEIGNLKNIVSLEIHGTGINELPKEIVNLGKLQILYIDKYLYKTLPQQIKDKISNKEIIDYSYYIKDYYLD